MTQLSSDSDQDSPVLLLAADTSGRQGSIALAQGDKNGKCELIEAVRLDGGSFSAQLVPNIASLLKKNGFAKSDIGGFAVVAGPGSFTGLRVGLAAIKGLAEILDKPIAAISLLDALAASHGLTLERKISDTRPSQSKSSDLVCALDAGRQQVFVGQYEKSGRVLRPVKESLLSRDEFSAVVREATVISPSSELVVIAQAAGASAHMVPGTEISVIAEMGWKKIIARDIVGPEDLQATYLVRPNTEIYVKSQP